MKQVPPRFTKQQEDLRMAELFNKMKHVSQALQFHIDGIIQAKELQEINLYIDCLDEIIKTIQPQWSARKLIESKTGVFKKAYDKCMLFNIF